MVQSSLTRTSFKKLKAFASAANKQAPSNPFDQDRWHGFVIGAHREDAQLAAQEVRDWLIDQGFPAEKAGRLAITYEFGRALLTQYDSA